MAWTAPMTFTAGAVLTAAQLNTYLRDNLNEVATAKAVQAGQYFVSTGVNSLAGRSVASGNVPAVESTTSTSMSNLTTFGPQLGVYCGNQAIVMISAWMRNDTAGAAALMSYGISGATTVAPGANDWQSIVYTASVANAPYLTLSTMVVHNVNTGTNIFTLQYRSINASTSTFAHRKLIVIPL